jgi:hypothetical protein
MEEMVQHNTMVEDLAKQKYLLEMKREEREKHKKRNWKHGRERVKSWITR